MEFIKVGKKNLQIGNIAFLFNIFSAACYSKHYMPLQLYASLILHSVFPRRP